MATNPRSRNITLESSQDRDDMVNFLAHYGVKGMRWGIINQTKPNASDASDSDISDKARKVASASAKIAGKAAKTTASVTGRTIRGTGRLSKNVIVKANTKRKADKLVKREIARSGGHIKTSSLSDEQLKAIVNRMTLEQQYAKLVATPAKQTKMQQGRKFIQKMLADQAKRQATAIFNAKTDAATRDLIKRMDAKQAEKLRKKNLKFVNDTTTFDQWKKMRA